MWDKSTEFEMLSEKAKKKKKAQILTYAWSIERANKWPLAGILAQKHSLL